MEIIIASYKPSSNDYCRGCLMESYSSDFHFCSIEGIIPTNDYNLASLVRMQLMERAAEKIANIDSQIFETYESRYEHTIRVVGFLGSDENGNELENEEAIVAFIRGLASRLAKCP